MVQCGIIHILWSWGTQSPDKDIDMEKIIKMNHESQNRYMNRRQNILWKQSGGLSNFA